MVFPPLFLPRRDNEGILCFSVNVPYSVSCPHDGALRQAPSQDALELQRPSHEAPRFVSCTDLLEELHRKAPIYCRVALRVALLHLRLTTMKALEHGRVKVNMLKLQVTKLFRRIDRR